MEDKPVVCFSDSTEGCVPLNVGFVNCSTGGDTYFWEFGDGSTSDQVNPSHMFADAGCYDITLTVTTAKGCSASLSKSCYISAHPLPTASFDADPWNTTILSPTVSLLDKSINATAWSWNFGDNSTDTSQNPTHVYKDTGCYNVTLALINQYGCVDTLSQTVCVKDIFTFYMPDAFSPNGDGINETFKPVQYGVCTFEMYIFDRWGNLIYETTSLAGWDGTANEGADMVQEDVYVWLVKAEDCDGRLIQRIGRVTVIK